MGDDYTNEVIIQGMYDGNLVTVAVDEDGNLQAILLGESGGLPKQIALDTDGKILAQLYGMYGSTPTPVAVSSAGELTVSSFAQTNVNPDPNEAQTWDAALANLVNNLNRIRWSVVHLSGEAWGTVSHSIADLWAKFNASAGHAHSGSANDGGKIDYSYLSGSPSIDLTPYYKIDGTRALTAGIPFPATAVPSADPNTLDDYEEGTWTPALTRAVTPSVIVYFLATGRYTKIGNIVNIWFFICITSITTQGSGVNRLTGIPFVGDSTTRGTGNIGYNGVFSSTLTQIFTVVDDYAIFKPPIRGDSSIEEDWVGAYSYLTGSATYKIA